MRSGWKGVINLFLKIKEQSIIELRTELGQSSVTPLGLVHEVWTNPHALHSVYIQVKSFKCSFHIHHFRLLSKPQLESSVRGLPFFDINNLRTEPPFEIWVYSRAQSFEKDFFIESAMSADPESPSQVGNLHCFGQSLVICEDLQPF